MATNFRNPKSTVFWDLTTCSLVPKYQSFGLACGLLLQSQIAHITLTVFWECKAAKFR